MTHAANQRKDTTYTNYDNDANRQNYQGMFAWKPDRTETGIGGSTETHGRVFGPSVKVHKDWYGNVTGVERS